MNDDKWLLLVLAQISQLERISQQWDRSEISNQNFKDQVQANSKQLSLLVSSFITNSGQDRPLAEVLLELQSQQELR